MVSKQLLSLPLSLPPIVGKDLTGESVVKVLVPIVVRDHDRLSPLTILLGLLCRNDAQQNTRSGSVFSHMSVF